MMFSTLVSVYLTIATVDGKPNEVFSPFFVQKSSSIKVTKTWKVGHLIFKNWNANADNDGLHDNFELFYEQLLKNQCSKIVYQKIQESSQLWKHDIGIH